MTIDFGANKTPVGVVKQGAFGGTHLVDIYSDVNGKCYRKSWKEFNELKFIGLSYYCSNYYYASVQHH